MNARRQLLRPPPFDPKAAYLVRRDMHFNGALLEGGAPFDATGVSDAMMKKLLSTRRIVRSQDQSAGAIMHAPYPQAGAKPSSKAVLRHLGFAKWTVELGGERLIEPTTKADAEAHLATL